jgi:glutamate synthase (NADPH/NADH) small chain
MQVELMPAPPSIRAANNPWPHWPLVFRTSSSQEEGGSRAFALRTQKLSGAGKLEALHAVGVTLAPDAEGRPTLRDLPATEVAHPVDLLILAMGFTGVDGAALQAQLGLTLTGRTTVQVDERFATSRPGVFAAGDAARGASLIVWAIAEGREAAKAVDAWLGQSQKQASAAG